MKNHLNSLLMRYLTLLICMLISISVVTTNASPRVIGSLGFQSYGYTDADEEEHLWLIQNTQIAAYCSKAPVSLHFSGQWLGDNNDEFGASSKMRFLKGYAQYGSPFSKNFVRAGRYFLYRGALFGAFDGLEAQYAVNSSIYLGAFVGMSGAVTRKFEFEDPAKSLAFGVDANYSSPDIYFLKRPHFSAGFASKSLDDNKYYNRIDLANNSKLGNHWTLQSSLRLRTTDEPLQRGILRVRYVDHKYSGIIEATTYRPDVTDFSFFKDFSMQPYHRVRTTWQSWFIPDVIGGGIDVTSLINFKGYGWRFGPMIMTKYGYLGYRLSAGEHSQSEGVWANLNYTPMKRLNTYATFSKTTYEWEAFDIESNEVQTVAIGGKWSPDFYRNLSIGAEYQVYKSPQFNSDNRAMGNLSWQFDTGVK